MRVGGAPESTSLTVAPAGGLGMIVSRAAFLACSWTWVIGMYLPVILMREFGWGGWAAFAIPNVVGAAGMGLVLRRRGASESMLEGRLRMASWFSAATIAFHAFFITWMGNFVFDVLLGRFAGIACAGLLFVCALGFSRMSSRAWGRVAIVIWLASVGMLLLAYGTGSGQFAAPTARGESDWTGLLFVAPVCVFGFALCPYLDLTFHRVRRETEGGAGSAAFVLGFGGLFLAMIVGTLLYAQGIISTRWWSFYLVAHIGLQSAFTVGAHIRERAALSGGSERAGAFHAALTPMLIGVAAGLVPGTVLHPAHASGETVYVLFMALYGLAFPAYVWLVMGARRPRALLWWAGTVGVASPMFWMGFVEQEWWWLGPGLLVAMAPRLATMRRPRRVVSPSA